MPNHRLQPTARTPRLSRSVRQERESMKKQSLQALPTVILVMICFWLASAWFFARFVHYHVQRQILAPAHYTADVMPVAGGVPAGAESADFRKSDDGQYYVRVATLGTAHHMARTTSDLFPPFALALVGVIAALVAQRKQKAEPNQQVQATR